jgi:hypothetical protein
MQNYRFKFVEKTALFVALILSTAFSLSVAAQRPTYPINRRIEEINRQSAENERDAMNRDLRGDSRKTENSKQRQALREQIKKDFEGIQAEYNKIVLNLKPNADVSRDFLIEAAGNIRERAARLKTNLALPETKDEKLKNAPEEKTESVRQSLLALCKHIYNFVTNPIFETPTGLDIEQSSRAQKDLEAIIQISDKIKTDAEKIK